MTICTGYRHSNAYRVTLPQNMIYLRIALETKVCTLTSKDLMAKPNIYTKSELLQYENKQEWTIVQA